MKTISKIASFVIIAAAAFISNHAKAEIVYQSNTNTSLGYQDATAFEIGDEITLGGDSGNRSLTNFTFQYTANFTGTMQGELRFYYNDGAAFNGYNTPGTMFFDSGPFSLGAFLYSGTHNLVFDEDFGPGLQLPDSFTWTIKFSGAGVTSAGVDTLETQNIGGNHNDYWQNNGGVWTLQQNTNGVPPINFAAQIEAVPEPSTIALGAMGCLLGWGLTRRNRR
jgi:hypothetical protein